METEINENIPRNFKMEVEDVQLAENIFVDDTTDDTRNAYDEKRELLRKTKIVKQTWSIQEIYQKIKSKKLKLSPDYQRNDIWQNDKKTAFIESLFMGILIPPIYVVEIPGEDMLEDSTYEVVDGKQRLTTVNQFLTGVLELQKKSLEYYTDWFSQKKFADIQREYSELTSEMLSSVLDIYVITANSPEFTKYDIFSRLNKGAEKLKVNEIRKAIYRSHTLEVIDEFVQSHSVKKATNEIEYERYAKIFSENDKKRYEDYGRFYRSVAFYIKSDFASETPSVLNYNSRPRDMINNVLQSIQNRKVTISKEDIVEILKVTLDLYDGLRSVSEGVDYIIDACVPFVKEYREALFQNLQIIASDSDISKSLEKSPATTSNVNIRLYRVKRILLGDGC